MSKRKKSFPCGHKAYGQKCYRCTQAIITREQTVQAQLQRQQQKRAWLETFSQDPIDLRDLPKHVVIKARAIITALEQRCNYTQFGGKRLRHDRAIISIPINRDYRMICRDDGEGLVPQRVLSHEEYNVCKPGR